jgi:Pentapeptide repeats (8 copies)
MSSYHLRSINLSITDNNDNCRKKQVKITIRFLSGITMIAFTLFSSIIMPSFISRTALATVATNDTDTATTDVQRIEALLEIVRCNAPFRSNVDLSGCDPFGASFEEAVLANADLSFADLTNATLEEAVLANADLTNATLTGTDFLSAVMTNCIGCPQ